MEDDFEDLFSPETVSLPVSSQNSLTAAAADFDLCGSDDEMLEAEHQLLVQSGSDHQHAYDMDFEEGQYLGAPWTSSTDESSVSSICTTR